MAYGKEFNKFVKPARARSQIWRTLVGLVLFAILYVVLALGIIVAAVPLLGLDDYGWLMSPDAMQQPLPVLWLLLTFLGMALAIGIVTKTLHRRPMSTLTGRMAILLRDFLKAAAVLLGLGIPVTLLWILFGDVQPNLELSQWLALLVFVLAGIALQTFAEELVFRGYLLQQLGARFRSPIAWMIFPSILFGFLHFDPEAAGTSALAIIAITGTFGVIAADLTARTGSLGAAWGFHFANNFLAIALVSLDGSLNGLSLYVTKFSLSEDGLSLWVVIADLTMMLLAWILTRRVLGH